MSQIVGRDCDCEDFPCCGHGITVADLQDSREQAEYARMFEDDRYFDDPDVFNSDEESIR